MSKCEALVATPQLRWMRIPVHGGFIDVLQQYWTDPLGVSGKGEWRDVPFVDIEPRSKPLNESPLIHCDGD